MNKPYSPYLRIRFIACLFIVIVTMIFIIVKLHIIMMLIHCRIAVGAFLLLLSH
jgi:hypothetical protein